MHDIQPMREFDHLMCGVKDVEEVGRTFEKLGFTVGPITPLEGIGVANRRILLTPEQENLANYIEFMQLGGASGNIPSYLQKWLAGSMRGEEGAHSYIMRTDDATATYAHFELRHQENPGGGFSPILLEKDFEERGPSGVCYKVGFSNCILPDLEPPFYISTSEIRTLDFYLDPQWRSHPNGAYSWVASIAVSATPRETAEALRDVWGGAVTEMGPNAIATGPGNIPLKIFTPDRFRHVYGIPSRNEGEIGSAEPYTAGVHISVADIGQTRDFLLSRNIDITSKDDYIIVRPELAHGLLLCFEQNDRTTRR